MSATGSSGPNVPGGSRSASTIAPIRSRMRRNPARVQLTPTRSSTSRESRTSTPAAIRNAAEDGSPGTSTSPSSSSSALPTVVRNPPCRHRPRARHGRAGGSQHPLGVVAARDGLDHGRRVGDEPGEQHARLDLRARDRKLVLDAGQRRAVDRERREAALARLDPRPHQRQRLGDPVDRAPANRVVAVELEARPLLERQPAGQQPHQRAGVADVDGSPGAMRVAQPAPADHDLLGARLDDRAELLHGRERRAGVGGVEVVADPHRLRRHRPDDRGAVGDRLVGRHREPPPQRPGRVEPDVHARATGNPSFADELLGAPRLVLAGDPQRDDALAHVGCRVQRHVGDVDARAAELERELRDHARSVRHRRAQLEQRAARELRLEQPAPVLGGGVVPRR